MFSSILRRLDVIEHCLAHTPGNRVRAAYNRHAYRAERRSLLQDWADHVEALRHTAACGPRGIGSPNGPMAPTPRDSRMQSAC